MNARCRCTFHLDEHAHAYAHFQVVGLIDDIPTCKEVIERMVAEAMETIQGRLGAMVAPASKL